MITTRRKGPGVRRQGSGARGQGSVRIKEEIMQNYSDQELVSLYLESKDLKYLTELFTRHSDIVYRTALRTMRNASDAEDVMQVAYIKMIKNFHLYSGSGSVLGWMLQTVVYSCYDQLRSEKSRLNRERKIMSERVTTTAAKNEELKEMVDNHLNKLPEIYRAPITLQILEGLTIKEVSEVLQIPKKTIRSQIARGLEKLRVSLQSVGITASVAAVSEMISEIQQPLAPEIYKTNQYFNSLYQQKSLASSKIAIAAGSKNAVLLKLIYAALIFSASIGGYIAWHQLTETKHSSPVPAVSIYANHKWDFENTKNLNEYKELGLIKGNIAISKKMGENGTNGLLVEEKSIIELDISPYKLPVKISYKTDYYFPKEGNQFGQMVVKTNYLKDQKVFFFSSIREKISVENNSSPTNLQLSGKWYQNVAYVDDKSIDFWVEGRRSQILLGQSSSNNKIFLSIYGKAVIDDLIVEPINESQLPDKRVFKQLAETTEIKEGQDVYPLDKEKIGLNKNSKSNPELVIMSAVDFEKNIGANQECIYPILNAEGEVVWSEQRKTISQNWNFEEFKQINDFKLIRGTFAIGQERGLEKSNCLALDAETVIEIDISKFKLPLKITFSFDCKVPNGVISNDFVIAKGNYEIDKNILFFVKLSEVPTINKLFGEETNENKKLGYHGVWLPSVSYVSEECVDQWMYGSRAGLTYGKSLDDQKLYLIFKDKTFVDNFKIESVETKDIPSVIDFKNLAATLPFEKTPKKYYQLGKEKEILHLDNNSKAELGICNRATVESVFGLDKKPQIIPINGN